MDHSLALSIDTDSDAVADFVQTWLISHGENIRAGLTELGLDATVCFSDNEGMSVYF